MNGNRMGPGEQGPKTGRGLGICGVYNDSGYETEGQRNGRRQGPCGQGMRLGRGRGRGAGQGFNRNRSVEGDAR